MYFEATALWRWSNYLQQFDWDQKIRVLINVDETSVRLVPEEGKGHVSNRAYRLLCSGMPLGRNASLAAQRSAITHVTAICDHGEIQKLLPQVVLVSENQFTEERAFSLRSEAPASVHLWRKKKAWMTTDIMVEYIHLLGRLLQEFQATHRFILYLDALRAHVSPRVLRAASRANLWICVIPSKMTWALQPCDTHVFASYKRMLGEEYQRRSGLTAAGDINWQILLEMRSPTRLILQLLPAVMQRLRPRALRVIKSDASAEPTSGSPAGSHACHHHIANKASVVHRCRFVGRRVPVLDRLEQDIFSGISTESLL